MHSDWLWRRDSMTGPVQTSLEKTGPRPPVLSESQSDSSGGNMHELATAGRARIVFRTPSVFISIYIPICVFSIKIKINSNFCAYCVFMSYKLQQNLYFLTIDCKLSKTWRKLFAKRCTVELEMQNMLLLWSEEIRKSGFRRCRI